MALTPDERETLIRYIRRTADAMELRDWTITLDEERPADEGCGAMISPVFGRKLATLQISLQFRNDTREEQRHTIVHELVHLHLESAANSVRRDLESNLGSPADLIFWNGFKRQIEYGVDALASALAKHLPVIDWPPSHG